MHEKFILNDYTRAPLTREFITAFGKFTVMISCVYGTFLRRKKRKNWRMFFAMFYKILWKHWIFFKNIGKTVGKAVLNGRGNDLFFHILCFKFFMFLGRSLRSDVFLSFFCVAEIVFFVVSEKNFFSFFHFCLSVYYLFNCWNLCLLEVKLERSVNGEFLEIE